MDGVDYAGEDAQRIAHSWEVNPPARHSRQGFLNSYSPPPANNSWDMTADGKRFLLSVSPSQQSAETPITVVLNSQADMKP